MLLGFLGAACLVTGVVFFLLCTQIDKSNNKGDSKGEFSDFAVGNLMIHDREDDARKPIPMR